MCACGFIGNVLQVSGHRGRHHSRVCESETRALQQDDLARRIRTLGNDLAGLRQRACLLLASTGAFRSRDLADVRVDELEWEDGELTVQVRRDRRTVRVAHVLEDESLCPVCALSEWLGASGIWAGFVFSPRRGRRRRARIRRNRP